MTMKISRRKSSQSQKLPIKMHHWLSSLVRLMLTIDAKKQLLRIFSIVTSLINLMKKKKNKSNTKLNRKLLIKNIFKKTNIRHLVKRIKRRKKNKN